MKKKTTAVLLIFAILFLGSCAAGEKDVYTGLTGAPYSYRYKDGGDTPEEEYTAAPDTTASSAPLVTAPVPTLPAGTAFPVKANADAVAAQYAAVGVQAAVISGGQVTSTYEYGSMNKEAGFAVNANTKYRVASLSKLVTDIVFMAMKDEGLVSETEDIGTYLGYSVRNPRYPETVITPEMLMCHSSSIIDCAASNEGIGNDSSIPIKTILSGNDCYSGSEPGNVFAYSNFGFAVLGAVCETVAGENFDALAAKYLFRPLAIDAAFVASDLINKDYIGVLYGEGGRTKEEQLESKFNAPGQNYHLMQGNLTISARDYAVILAMLMNGGKTADGKTVLSPASVASILSTHIRDGEQSVGYGLWSDNRILNGVPVLVHTGSSYGMYSAFAFDPAAKKGVVVLTSGANGSQDPDTDIYNICADLIRLLYPA